MQCCASFRHPHPVTNCTLISSSSSHFSTSFDVCRHQGNPPACKGLISSHGFSQAQDLVSCSQQGLQLPQARLQLLLLLPSLQPPCSTARTLWHPRVSLERAQQLPKRKNNVPHPLWNPTPCQKTKPATNKSGSINILQWVKTKRITRITIARPAPSIKAWELWRGQEHLFVAWLKALSACWEALGSNSSTLRSLSHPSNTCSTGCCQDCTAMLKYLH